MTRMAGSEAEELLRLLDSKFHARPPWPAYPKDTVSEVQDLFEDLWEQDVSIAGMVSKVLETRKPPRLRWRGPLKLRKRIERVRRDHSESAEFLDQLQRICDGLEELMDLVERLRKTP